MKAISTFTLLVSLFLAIPLAAQEKPTDLSEISLDDLLDTKVSVASTRAETIFTAPSTVTVIDRDMIRQYNLLTVADALQLVPGFDVTRTYLKHNIPQSRGILQEHYANKVLVMVDGVPVWSAVTGEAYLDRIAIGDVERIEVLKGPASVLYGTNAYTGAVNLVLKRRDSSEAELTIGAGIPEFFLAGGNVTRPFGKGTLLVSANSYSRREPVRLFSDEKAVSGHIRDVETSGSFNLVFRHPHHQLVFNSYSFQEPYLGVTPLFAEGAGREHLARGTMLHYDLILTPGKKLTLTWGSGIDSNQRNLGRKQDNSERSLIRGYRLSSSLRAGYAASASLSLELGADWDYRRSQNYNNYNVLQDLVLTDNNMKGRHVSEYSFYGQATWTRGKLTLLLGTRATHNDLFGWNNSLRGTLVYAIDPRNSLKLIFGQSYRAPSLFELYFETPTKTVTGNVNLKPETSNSFELAYLTSFRNVFVQALVFHAIYDNKIFRAKVGDYNTYVNGNDFNATGVELEVKYQDQRKFNLFVNYSYIDGTTGDETASEPGHANFKYVPQHTVSAGLSKGFGGFLVSGLVNFLSSTRGPLGPIDGQAVLDLNASYTHKAGNVSLRHSLSVKDLLDDDFTIPEYARRRGLNAIPFGYARIVCYSLAVLLPF